MARPWLALAAPLVGLAVIGCRTDGGGHSALTDPRRAAVDPRAEPQEGGDARPVSDYEDEREARALRGLRYDSGRVEIVPEEARVLVAGPDASAAEAALAAARAHVARNERLDAVAACTRAVLLAPDDASAYEGLGDALVLQRWYPRAVAAFRSGLDLAPQRASLHYRLGETLWRLGERAPARAELQESVRLDPDLAEAHVRLASVLYYEGEPAAAWDALRRAEALGAGVPPQLRVLLAERLGLPQQEGQAR